ncbi:MAG: hypothetical protein L0228_11825 [Planctomycetes bacterium]|nr:hypothetical protein [Planctomycetota bacterium]
MRPHNDSMESLVHNVKDMPPETRRGFETALGETLRDDQRVYVIVVTPGVEPSDRQRAEALADLRELGARGAKNRESLGVSVDEANKAVDEAMENVRPPRDRQ